MLEYRGAMRLDARAESTMRTANWLLAGQLLLGVGELAALGFFVWKARTVMDRLAKNAAGTAWATDALTEVFSKVAANSELAATAAWNSSVATQAIARELRPLTHDQTLS